MRPVTHIHTLEEAHNKIAQLESQLAVKTPPYPETNSNLYHQLFLESQVGLFILDRSKNTLLDGNEVFARLIGFDSRSTMLSEERNIWEYCITKSERDNLLKNLNLLNHIDEAEFQINTYAGTHEWVRLSAHLDNSKQILHGVVEHIENEIIAREALKNSEERLNLAIKSSDMGTWDWDLKNNTSLHSRWLCKKCLLPYESIPRDLHHFWISRILPVDRKYTNDTLLNHFLKSDKPIHHEYRIQNHSGETLWLSLTGQVFERDTNGNPLRAVGVHQDITKRREFENEILNAKEEAESANRAKSEFLAMMSHEIRTPLNAMLGFNELLSSNIEDEEQKYMHDIIKTSGSALLKIINDILDLSKIESGHFKINNECFNPSMLVEELMALFEQQADEKNIKINFEKDPRLPETVRSDENLYRQVITNLLGNALKFTKSGDINVKLYFDSNAARTNKENKLSLNCSIKDSGIGISDTQIKNLFKPFSQADTGKSREYEGTGLGLTLSQRFAHLLGGDVTVSSSMGKGSTFTFSAEVTLSEPIRALEEPKSPVSIIPFNFSAKHPLKILVVEDVYHNMMLITSFLKKSGYEPTESNDGLEAITILENESYDLILMDIQMPRMDGYEATKQIRKRMHQAFQYDAPVQIIALTACALKTDKETALQAGFDEYLTKPLNFREVQTKLAEAHSVLSD